MASSSSPKAGADTASAAKRIAGYTLIPVSPTASQVATETSQAAHRLKLVSFWDIAPGSRILEIGCGQGTCTAVLADAVGQEGFIDAIDPGPPDYGAPYTLAQSQAHISRSAIGDRIAWHHADPYEFLEKQSRDRTWDAAVLVHCIWYFDRPKVLHDLLYKLKGRVKRVLIAEYALQATQKAAMPHLFASIARATLEAHNPDSTANIRCLLASKQIVECAKEWGWKVEKETTIEPQLTLEDGYWETLTVKSDGFLTAAGVLDSATRVSALLESLRDAMLTSMEKLEKDGKVRTMDVWVSSFTC